MLDLNPDYAKIVQKILKDHIPDKTVWVYGSRVKGTAHAASDLDLVVFDLDDSFILSTLRSSFSESNLPISVDILSWIDIPDSFKTEIEQSHEVFQYPA